MIWLVVAIVLALLWRRPGIFLRVLVADAIADLVATGLKDAIPRHRPHVHALVPLPHTNSFPSGHSATSFACATVIAASAPRLRIPAFVLAAAIAYSRVYNGVHWPTDVVAGAALGVAVGLLVRALRLPAGRRRGSRRGSRAG